MNRKNSIKFIVYLLLLTGAVIVFASAREGLLTLRADQIKNTAVKVQLKWQHNAQFAGMYVAKEKGLYEQNGLNVKLIERDNNSKTGSENLESGAVDFAIMSPFEFLLSYSQGEPLKAIGSIYQKSPAILSSLGSVKLLNPKDFEGRSLGVSSDGLDAKMMYLGLASSSRIPVNSFSFNKISFDQIGDLAAGKADIISHYRTQSWYKAKSMGLKLNNLDPADFGLLINDDIIVTTDNMINNHPEIVKKFMSATISGWKYALRRQGEAVDYTIKYAHGDYIDPKYEQYILDQSIPLILPEDGKKIGTMNPKIWKNLYNFFTENTLVKHFDISQGFTNKFIE